MSDESNILKNPLHEAIRDHLQAHWSQFTKDGKRPDGWFSDSEGDFYLEVVKRHPNGIVVELGTHLGRSLSYIVDFCKASNIRLYAVDLWIDLPQLPNRYTSFVENLKKMGAQDYVKVLQMESSEAAKNFHDNEVDVVFIDTLHSYDITKSELNAWWSKLKVGGEILGHDYCQENEGLIRAVNEAFGKPDAVRDIMWLVKKNENNRMKF